MIKYLNAKEYKGMTVKIEEKIDLICKISKESFQAKIILKYIIKNKQIELVSLRKYLESFKEENIESLCKKIKTKISKELSVDVTVIGISKIHPKCEVSL